MDERFIKKVYKSSVIAWSVAMFITLCCGKPWIALSITLGAAVSLAGLASYEKVVREVFVPGSSKQKKALVKLALIKFPLLCALLYLVVHWNKINLLAFCGGILLTHIALLAKLGGIRLMESLRAEAESDPDRRS